jgi:hypothetical protein
VSFAAITVCVASQRVFIVVVIVDFVIDSARKLWIYPRLYTKSWSENLKEGDQSEDLDVDDMLGRRGLDSCGSE